MDSESALMRALIWAGAERLAWSLRRLHVPVSDDALVLEVGSGGNSYPRANVLLDAYEDSIERADLDARLVKDRPLVLGTIEKLPFRDKSFDFVIASHVLEHSAQPEAFLTELMRVGRAGYIETPDALFERLNPFRYHRLEVTAGEEGLVVWKKPSWRPYGEWVDLYEKKLKDDRFLGFVSAHPAPFYTRYYWRDRIRFRVLNPEVDASWAIPVREGGVKDAAGLAGRVRRHLVHGLRPWLSQRGRNRRINVLPLLRCPTCGGEADLKPHAEGVRCGVCRTEYAMKEGAYCMYDWGVPPPHDVKELL